MIENVTESLDEALIRDLPDRPAGRVVVGFNWIAVEGSSGLGFAATPTRSDGARAPTEPGSYGGRSLADLGRLIGSDNLLERAIAIAAANAHWNRVTGDLSPVDGLLGSGISGRTVVIGRFPGLAEKLPGAVVLERNPGPDDLPAEAAAQVIPGCDQLIITGTALMNRTIGGLIQLASPGTEITLVGPGTPLAPGLFDCGLHRLAGFVAVDQEACLKAVMEGAGARVFKKFGRQVVRHSAP